MHLYFMRFVSAAHYVDSIILSPQIRFSTNSLSTATPPHPSASRPPSPQGEGILAGTSSQDIYFCDGKFFFANHRKSNCGAQRRGIKPPPGGINGFNAVKARWDGIERIQEVSESPAQLDFAALQAFSTHAPPKSCRRTQPKTKNTE